MDLCWFTVASKLYWNSNLRIYSTFLSLANLTSLAQMFGPTDAGGQVRNNGFYDPFSYRFWTYPKTARNVFENRLSSRNLSDIEGRSIRPRKLCFLDAITRDNPTGVLAEAEWNDRNPKYIFISYTADQFRRRCKTEGDCRCKYTDSLNWPVQLILLLS